MAAPNQSVPPTGSPWPVQGRPGPTAGLVYAGFGVRLGALIIDLIIVGIINSAVSNLFGLGTLGFAGWDPGELARFRLHLFGGAWFAWLIVQAVISGVYFVYGWTHWGASLGQRFLGLQVLNDANGAMMNQDTAIRRWALVTVPIIGSIPPISALVALYWLYLAWTTANDPNKQGFHDKQCGTVVVQPR